MTYEDIIAKVSETTGLSKRLVDKAYKAYWRGVRQHITALPLKEDLTDEEFLRLQPNINIPSIGKLYVTLDRYHGIKRNFERAREYYKDNNHKKDNNAEN